MSLTDRVCTFLTAVVCYAMICVTAALICKAAYGHGDAHWIEINPKYLGADGLHCCGEDDCRRALPGELVRVKGGWLHVPTDTEILDDQRGIYPSERDDLFICVRSGRLRCVFPAIGT